MNNYKAIRLKNAEIIEVHIEKECEIDEIVELKVTEDFIEEVKILDILP